MNYSNHKFQDSIPPRDLFPITRESIYFNHAATGPLSLPARRAIEECMDVYARQAEFTIDAYFRRVNTARSNVAKLIGAEQEEITFTHNTSEGLYIALINVPLRAGDKILVMDEVFPAARYVVDYNIPHIEKQYIPFLGRDPIEVIKANLDKRVKVVLVDSVQFFSGEAIDVKGLSYFLKENNIYFIVDGIQAIGAMDFSVRETEIDFLACGAAKWLFGPSGAGFLYINKHRFNDVKRLHTGWLGANWTSFECYDTLPHLFNDARMFEQGTRNIIGISAFSENIKLLLEFGLENVSQKIGKLRTELRKIFEELDYEIITPMNALQSGIVTIRPKDDPKQLFERLSHENIAISLRSNCLRFSPHFYNTLEEVEQIFRILKQ